VTPKIWAKAATYFNATCATQGVDRDEIQKAYKNIEESLEKPVAKGETFLIIGSILVFCIWYGIPSASIFCLEDGANPFSFCIGTILIIFHITCLCLVRKYRTASLDAFNAMNGELSGINSCLDARN